MKITAITQLNLEASSKAEFYQQIVEANRIYGGTDMYPYARVPAFFNRAKEPMSIDDLHWARSVLVHKFMAENPLPEFKSGGYLPYDYFWTKDRDRYVGTNFKNVYATESEFAAYNNWNNSRGGNSWAQLGQELFKVAGLAAVVVGGVSAAAAIAAPAAGAATAQGSLAGSAGLLGNSGTAAIGTIGLESSSVAGIIGANTGIGTTASVIGGTSGTAVLNGLLESATSAISTAQGAVAAGLTVKKTIDAAMGAIKEPIKPQPIQTVSTQPKSNNTTILAVLGLAAALLFKRKYGPT